MIGWLTLLGGGLSSLFLSACIRGPDYLRPNIDIPASFKGHGSTWKQAKPADEALRTQWWEVFDDPILNELITAMDISNQTLARAEAQYRAARAAVEIARASTFLHLGWNASATQANNVGSKNPLQTLGLSFNASWELDVWGSIRQLAQSSRATADASLANVHAARLSAQAALAQNYVQLRVLDAQQKLLDRTVMQYHTMVALTENQYAVGVAAKADVIAAQAQWKMAQSLAIHNGILRAQMENAIALSLGKTASSFTLPAVDHMLSVPVIPIGFPSALLERRPDVAAAERAMAAANAQIGVAALAYFPQITLSAATGVQSNLFANLMSTPSRWWSVGPALSQIIFNGGLRRAQTAQALANYDATAAAYKQTVLTSFQEVENHLAALHILSKQVAVQKEAVDLASSALTITMNQYKSGIVNYASVITAQASTFSAEQSALSLLNQQLSAAVLLMKALGGGWNGLR